MPVAVPAGVQEQAATTNNPGPIPVDLPRQPPHTLTPINRGLLAAAGPAPSFPVSLPHGATAPSAANQISPPVTSHAQPHHTLQQLLEQQEPSPSTSTKDSNSSEPAASDSTPPLVTPPGVSGRLASPPKGLDIIPSYPSTAHRQNLKLDKELVLKLTKIDADEYKSGNIQEDCIIVDSPESVAAGVEE